MHFCLLRGDKPTLGRTLTRLIQRQITIYPQYMVLYNLQHFIRGSFLNILHLSNNDIQDNTKKTQPHYKHNWGDQCAREVHCNTISGKGKGCTLDLCGLSLL